MWAVLVIFLFLLLASFRTLYVLWKAGTPLPPTPRKRTLKTIIVLGSGGHTAEMLSIVAVLDKQRFYPRYYIAGLTDNMSLARAQTAEDTTADQLSPYYKQHIHYLRIYRSREVGQSYITSVMTTLIALLHGMWIVFHIRPDIILCNGPGTCIPVCAAGFFLKVAAIKWVVIVYVESIARVKRFSLSGYLLYKLRLADQIFVQWPQLEEKFPRSKFVGRLM